MRRALLAAALALQVPLAHAQQPPSFSTGIAYTYVDVFVSKGGRPVPGLRASDFELKDQGVVQQAELVSAEARSVQAVLVFDTSSSVAGAKLAGLRRAGEAFLDGLRPADEAALVTFSEEVTWQAQPTVNKASVRSALSRLHAAGATAVFDALYTALTLSDPRGRSLVVLFTDGDDNTSLLGERELRTTAERSSALIHVVGLRGTQRQAQGTESVQMRALREIAEASGGRYWAAESPERLGEAFAAIAASMGERYVLRYEPTGVKAGGWHRLEVKLRGAKGSVQARRGYWGVGS